MTLQPSPPNPRNLAAGLMVRVQYLPEGHEKSGQEPIDAFAHYGYEEIAAAGGTADALRQIVEHFIESEQYDLS